VHDFTYVFKIFVSERQLDTSFLPSFLVNDTTSDRAGVRRTHPPVSRSKACPPSKPRLPRQDSFARGRGGSTQPIARTPIANEDRTPPNLAQERAVPHEKRGADKLGEAGFEAGQEGRQAARVPTAAARRRNATRAHVELDRSNGVRRVRGGLRGARRTELLANRGPATLDSGRHASDVRAKAPAAVAAMSRRHRRLRARALDGVRIVSAKVVRSANVQI
jgi:hypothetical protein